LDSPTRLVSRRLPAVKRFLKKFVASEVFLPYSLMDLFIDEEFPTLVDSLTALETVLAWLLIYFSKYFDSS
jgi:hypothetical protein